MTRAVLTAATWLGSLAAVGTVAFFAVLILAGPHGGVLGSRATPFVLGAAWLVVLVVPVLLARVVWRRTTP